MSNNKSQPTIVIDGVFFQFHILGVARVWMELLKVWIKNGFAEHLIILDRQGSAFNFPPDAIYHPAGTMPRLPGLRYRLIPSYSYDHPEQDRQLLQRICDEEGADLFLSTYYTTPITTPSILMLHDMIPEIQGLDEPHWRQKHYSIKYASAYIAVSQNTAKDFLHFFPEVNPNLVKVIYNGVDHQVFFPASSTQVDQFKQDHGLTKPYFLLVGVRTSYKNAILFFKSFAQLANQSDFSIVCVGGGWEIEEEFKQYTTQTQVLKLQLTDQELSIAYSGAIALVYPSLYEGFGLAVLEAITCGCPVITYPSSAIPEVLDKAAFYIDDDIEFMKKALINIQNEEVRKTLIQAGLVQSQKFSWVKMADEVSNFLINETLKAFNLREINLIMFPDWTQSEDDLYLQLGEVIQKLAADSNADKTTLLIYIGDTDAETADLILSSITMNLMMETEIDVTENLQISLMLEINEKQWENLVAHLDSILLLSVQNQQAIAKFQAERLPIWNVSIQPSAISKN